MSQQTDRVAVVTAFLYSRDRIAIIRRSDRVSTYPGAWAAFSGYVERLPLEQAYTELLEEAGLRRNDVKLKGIGIPLPVDDERESRRWLVFPFLFGLTRGAEIKTDWETAELRWVKPAELRGLDVVPGLAQALDCVWPPFGDRLFWDSLADVATNTDLGATELARRGLQALGGYVQEHWEDIGRNDLLRAIRAFAACRPVMGIFPGLAARLLLAIERQAGEIDLDVLTTELLDAVDDATELSASVAAEALKGRRRLLTLSYSEAVKKAILRWRTGDSEVLVAESAPRKEGILLAEELASELIRAKAIRDEDVPAAIKHVDAVLVGCDAIAEGDLLVNKVGTLSTVLEASKQDVLVYSIAQTAKIAPPGWPVYLEHQEPWQAGLPGLVFDATPLSRFHAVFTEEGPLTLGRLNEIRAELGTVDLVPGQCAK